MTYLDTGCLVRLYYPEPDSPQVIALVQGQPLFFTPLHELKMTNALQLKVFSRNATAEPKKKFLNRVDFAVKSLP